MQNEYLNFHGGRANARSYCRTLYSPSDERPKIGSEVAVFWLDFAEPYLRQSDGMNVLLIQALQNFLDDSVSLRVHLGSVQQICVRQL